MVAVAHVTEQGVQIEHNLSALRRGVVAVADALVQLSAPVVADGPVLGWFGCPPGDVDNNIPGLQFAPGDAQRTVSR